MLREGYKQTEIGVIPEDWEVKQLGEIADIDPENLTRTTYAEYEFRYVSLEDVERGVLKAYSNQVFCTAPSRARRVLRDGDVLLSTVRPNLKSHLLFNKQEYNWICSTGFSVLRCKKGLSIPAFLFSHLFSGNIDSQIETLIAGSNYPAINSSDVQKLKIAVSTIKEQRSLSQALSDVDALVAALDKLIAKNRDLKTATMQQLLTGKKRLPGFAGEWHEEQLGTIAEIIDPHPSHRAPAEKSFGIPFVGIGDITTEGNINSESARLVGENIFNEHRNRYCLEDCLIGIGRVASIGKVVRLKMNVGKYVVSPTIAVIKAKTIDVDYLLYFLLSRAATEQFDKISNGSTRQSVGMNVLRDIFVNFPKNIEEQRAIALVLSDTDNAISLLESRLAKTKAIKLGMMQELLTGRTRLV
ncbi:restriction endonuclease subunit S [Chlorogloea sp. CCALA 695]|uniref:restriction endonuclease subunit S n=1 Tax=Chlorogloea sp. CCALA 695 TaxID=2107693 RepID=UPI000D06375B|nr:restriction endonuclease subunit S [Chlorogloea sp. CCALA 695]PSB30108.1 hypothetical protein C7B70_17075 [Chlorogloea sp. CCALA 695]